MSHRHTVIEPAEGLTVLVGPNNCGKSAVITALQILAHNDNSTYVIRHGEKQASVSVSTDDGHEVVWQRKKSGSTSYMIDGKLFDRLRNGIPDELRGTLRLPKVDLNTSNDQIDIHFGMQKQPVFLLNEPGKTAAGFFAASSDASRLIEMQRVHKDRVRSKKQDAKRLESETEALQDEVDKLQGVSMLADLLQKCDRNKIQLVAEEQRTEQLKTLIEKLQALTGVLKCCEKMEQALVSLPDVPQFVPTNALGAICDKLKRLGERKSVQEKVEVAASQLQVPPQLCDEKALKVRLLEIRRLHRRRIRAEHECELLGALQLAPEQNDLAAARKLCSESSVLAKRMAKLDAESAELGTRMDAVESDIQAFVKENATCPSCQQPLSSDNVLQHLKEQGVCHET